MDLSSRLYGRQRGHGEHHQTCLALLAHGVFFGGGSGARPVREMALQGVRLGNSNRLNGPPGRRGEAAGTRCGAGTAGGNGEGLPGRGGFAGQDRPRVRPDADVQRISGRGRGHQQPKRASFAAQPKVTRSSAPNGRRIATPQCAQQSTPPSSKVQARCRLSAPRSAEIRRRRGICRMGNYSIS